MPTLRDAMFHLADFIRDLAIILITAAVVSVLFKRLNQPVILGYLIAGLFLSPSLGVFKQVSGPEGIRTWGEIGVIFLMFNLGLEFSFKKLVSLGGSVFTTAFSGMATVFVLGFLAAQVLGYGQINSIFVGGMLCLSSTMIILKTVEDMGIKSRPASQALFGVLVVEDLVSVLLLALLSTVAATKTLSGEKLFSTAFGLVFFIASWLLIGLFFLPRILRSIRLYLNEETTLMVSIGLCLLMVVIATRAGFSPALGAFVMGSLLAETKEANHIIDLLKPLRHLFSAIFFVSIGMLIDPEILFQNFWKVAVLVFVVVIGKPIGVVFGAILGGRTLRDAVAIAMSMPQVGEFSFVIAALGLSLKVLDKNLYPIIIAVSCVTGFLTPYIIRRSPQISQLLEAKIPDGLRRWIFRYGATLQRASSRTSLAILARAYFPVLFLALVNTVVFVHLAKSYVIPYGMAVLRLHETEARVIATSLCSVLLCPFLWAVVFKPAPTKALSSLGTDELGQFKFVALATRVVFAMGLVLFIGGSLLGGQVTSIIFFSVVLVSFGLLSKHIGALYHYLERSYLNTEPGTPALEASTWQRFSPWEVSLAEFVVPVKSEIVGLTIQESAIKERFGATIVVIERSTGRIIAPRATDRILPFDRLHFVGVETQFKALEEFFRDNSEGVELMPAEENFKLEAIDTLPAKYVGIPLRESKIGQEISGLVVGIERGCEQILNPTPDEIIKPDDRIWVVGLSAKIGKLRRESSHTIRR